MRSRLLLVVLLALLAALQAQLWLGRGSIPRVAAMQNQLNTQKTANAQANEANERLASEVHDLMVKIRATDAPKIEHAAKLVGQNFDFSTIGPID